MNSQAPDRLDPEKRMRLLVETGIALASESSLDTLLERVVATAVDLTGARYGALGVIERRGAGLERFITVGLDAAAELAIGDPPSGRGLLGALIRDLRPLRLDDLRAHPESLGFPGSHPSMTSFLGVPILIRGRAFGILLLTDKGGCFDGADEEVAALLAAQAAVAIENIRLYESAQRWSRQLESLNEVSEVLATEAGLGRPLALAAERLRELLDVRGVMVGLPSADGRTITIEAVAGEDAERIRGMTVPIARSKMGLAFTHRRSERIDSVLDDPEIDQVAARTVGSTAALIVPLLAGDRALGVLSAWDKQGDDLRFTDTDVRTAEAFANRAAVAVELADRVSRQSVETLVEGQERERSRVARELHDETLQLLAVLRMRLEHAERRDDLGAYRDAARQVCELLDSGTTSLRAIVADLRPPGLEQDGIGAGLERLAERSGLDVRLELHLAFEQGLAAERLAPELETTVYRIVQEALSNAARHAGAPGALVRVTEGAGEVEVLVRDEGVGFDPGVSSDHFGLLGIRERAELLGGSVEIVSTPLEGTSILARLPLRRREPVAR